LVNCYRVADPDLHALLLSQRARVKIAGEYMCCSQCHGALQNDRLEQNLTKFAISNNFAIGCLPDNLSNCLT
jgi:hypothetical protein